VVRTCRYNDVSKAVARTLNSVGFKNCWVMAGGFSGRKVWVGIRVTRKFRVGLFGFLKFRILRIVTRNLPKIMNTQHFGFGFE